MTPRLGPPTARIRWVLRENAERAGGHVIEAAGPLDALRALGHVERCRGRGVSAPPTSDLIVRNP